MSGGKILVFGCDGQVGRALVRAGGANMVGLDRAACDLTNPGAIAAAIGTHAPAAVINAAAYTAVDRAESESGLAQSVNADAPGAMARACADRAIPLIHLSTDYVFDGSGDMPYRPNDPTGPLGVYGSTKLAGEIAVRAARGVHAILRTSWVFSADGNNFVKTMLRLGQTRDTTGEALRVVDDQIGGPTPAADIAAACLRIVAGLAENPGHSGTYHFAGTPDVSWKGFAEAVFAMSGLDVMVIGIQTADYPTPTRRPANSRLDCSRLTTAFGIERPDWQTGLAAVLDRLGG